MPRNLRIVTALSLMFSVNFAYAYGSGSSSTHCDKPVFSDFKPAANKYLQSFDEFSVVASGNTTATSIVVDLGLGENKIHFSNHDLEITTRKTGQHDIKGRLERPISGGFVRFSVTAHSKPGCEKTDGVLIRIH
jgi:hypothetical protein